MSATQQPEEEVEEVEEEVEEEEGEDDEFDMEEDEDEDGFMDMGGLLSQTLADEEGNTVCSALVNIGKQLEMQNKILVKIMSQLAKKEA